VHTHSSKAGIIGRWAAKICGVPVIVHTIHGWSFNKYVNRFLSVLYIFLERISAEITTCLIAVSESDIAKGQCFKIGKPSQYTLIRYGVELDKFNAYTKQAQQVKAACGDDEARIVGMIACLKPQKNPLDFLRAAEIMTAKRPKTRFVLVGDGLLRPAIERFIKTHRLQGKVTLLGWRRDISEILAAMDIIVLTSLWEGLPIVLLEAMAAGKPVVAYDTDGIKEVILNNENGYLLKQGDVVGLAEKIIGLLDDQKKAEAMGARGREILSGSQHRTAVMMRSVEQLYAKLIGNITLRSINAKSR